MQIKDESDKIRVQDAYRHDDVMVMIGDKVTGRPLLTLSVTKGDGTALIEYEPGDLAAGILQLNQILSELARDQVTPEQIRLTP